MRFDNCYLDLNNLLFSAHSVAVKRIIFAKGESVHIGTIINFLRQVLKLKRKFDVKNWYAVGDSKSNLKFGILPSYKSNRKHKPNFQNFITQKIIVLDHLKYIGVNYIKKDGLEADELIFALARGGKNLIVSTDTDFYSCLKNGNILCRRKVLYRKKDFLTDYSIDPKYWDLIQSLVGKSGSAIPGVPGVGIKRALEVVKLNQNNFLKKLNNGTLTGQTKLLGKIYQYKKLIKRNIRLFSNSESDMTGFVIEKTPVDLNNKRLKIMIDKYESLFQII